MPAVFATVLVTVILLCITHLAQMRDALWQEVCSVSFVLPYACFTCWSSSCLFCFACYANNCIIAIIAFIGSNAGFNRVDAVAEAKEYCTAVVAVDDRGGTE